MVTGTTYPERAPVVLLHDSLEMRGGGEVVLDVVKSRLEARGGSVLACLFGAGDVERRDFVVDLEYPRHLSLATAPGTLRAQRRLEDLFGGPEPRACVAFTYPAAVRAALAALRLPRGHLRVAWICQEDVEALLTRGHYWARRAAFALIERAGCRVGCLNAATFSKFSQLGFPATRLDRLRQGISVERFRPVADDERRQLRVRLGLPPSDFVVACVANLYPLKGHGTLLEAVRRCRAASLPITLALVGAVPPAGTAYAEALRARGGEHVRWVGHSSSVECWLGAADAAALASEVEVASLFLREAAACGIPAVASDVPGNREVVREGRTGFLFPVGDASACAAALERLAREPALARTMGQAARAVAVDEYDITRTVESFDRLVASVATPEADR